MTDREPSLRTQRIAEAIRGLYVCIRYNDEDNPDGGYVAPNMIGPFATDEQRTAFIKEVLPDGDMRIGELVAVYTPDEWRDLDDVGWE